MCRNITETCRQHEYLHSESLQHLPPYPAPQSMLVVVLALTLHGRIISTASIYFLVILQLKKRGQHQEFPQWYTCTVERPNLQVTVMHWHGLPRSSRRQDLPGGQRCPTITMCSFLEACGIMTTPWALHASTSWRGCLAAMCCTILTSKTLGICRLVGNTTATYWYATEGSMQTERCTFMQLGTIHRFIQNGRYVKDWIPVNEVEGEIMVT